MIIAVKKNTLSADTILQRISEYDIFKYYMKENFTLNKVTYSPFRDEQHPSFMIGNKHGNLYFIDFADSSKRGNCFTFVELLYGLNFNECLQKIDRDFGLGISSNTNIGEYKRIKSSYKQPEELGKRYSMIQVVTRKFTKEELDYWNQYHQDIQDLRDNHIYSISKVFLNKKLMPISDDVLRFGYLYEDRWKIYRPFESKKSKWVPNNVPITVMDGKKDIINCKTALITKSKKDYMMIKKVFPYVCAVQNEGIACFSNDNVEYLKANSDRQVLLFDSDVTGVQNSQQITKLFDFGYCNVPRKYLSEGIKDFADLGKNKGLKVIEEYFKEKQIL